MNTLLIRGGRPLHGQVTISGSKNAVLPMLAAAALFREPIRLRGCPDLTDVDVALEILRCLGAKTHRQGKTIEVDPRTICRWQIPGDLMCRMRGSVFFAGPLLARMGQCELGVPGGCPIGARPVDFHADGFRKLGARQNGIVFSGPLIGTEIVLPYPSVGATENLLMAALGASGTTIIQNAAREPEIVCLCDFLRRGGCRIHGDGSSQITVYGGLPTGADFAVIPDRMEAATFACAAACAGGEVCLEQADHTHLTAVLDVLERSGCRIHREEKRIILTCHGLHSPGVITTAPYPGFPTDAQAPMLAAMTRAEGETIIRETVFDRRMGHLSGLHALGARIDAFDNTARITGKTHLQGAELTATDLRGGGALAVAALAAQGESRIGGIHHILRGYEDFDGKLRMLGADARLIQVPG